MSGDPSRQPRIGSEEDDRGDQEKEPDADDP